MGKTDRREIWRERVGKLLDSGLPVKTWCAINEISYPMMYRWLATFKDQEPEVLGGYDIAHAGDGHNHWVEYVMRARTGEDGDGRRDPDSRSCGFAVIELAASPFDGGLEPPSGQTATHPIAVTYGSITVSIANDANVDLVKAVIAGVCAR